MINLKPTSLSTPEFRKAIAIRPNEILASNSKLSQDKIHNVTMPAFNGWYLNKGNLTKQITCPNAGACKGFCYASSCTYGFTNSMIKHGRNLNYLMNDVKGFVEQLVKEISIKVKHSGVRAIRFNDSGDIFGDHYWSAIIQTCQALPHVQFYAYSKQVSYLKDKMAKGEVPSNFTVVFSFGGKEDHLIDTNVDRHAKVFPNRASLRAAGYSDGTNTDRLACNAKYQKIGLVVHGNHLRLHKLRKMVSKITLA